MAKLTVTEYAATGQAAGHPQAPQEPAITDQQVDFTSGVAPSSAFGSSTTLVRLYSDTACNIKFGANPTATTANQPLAANVETFRAVRPGDKVSVIAS